MLWFILKQMRKIVRKIGRKIGAISPYDFYDYKVPWASKKEILRDKKQYNILNTDKRFILDSKNDYFVRHLKYINTEHGIDYIPTYVRDLWSVKQIFKHKPKNHYDCGSSFSGFITPLIPLGLNIVLVDIRDLKDKFNTSLFKGHEDTNGGGGLSCLQSDITKLNEIRDESVESFSIIGAFDAFGLGIYGDPINPDAWRLALLSVQRVLKSGARFYLAAQTGKQNLVRFNAGRVFTISTICGTLDKMQLDELHFIKGNELETYPCIWHDNCMEIINDDNMNYLLNQDSITTLMIFKKR